MQNVIPVSDDCNRRAWWYFASNVVLLAFTMHAVASKQCIALGLWVYLYSLQPEGFTSRPCSSYCLLKNHAASSSRAAGRPLVQLSVGHIPGFRVFLLSVSSSGVTYERVWYSRNDLHCRVGLLAA